MVRNRYPGLHSLLESWCLSLLQAVPEEKSGDVYSRVMEDMERILLRLALRECGGNQRAAANRLGLHRNTLRRKIKSLDLNASQ